MRTLAVLIKPKTHSKCILYSGGNDDYIEHIAKAVEFIEQNLADEIDLAACARSCGYSQHRFLRVFKEVLELTPTEYIRRRRLSEIAKGIYQNNEYVSEIAFAYGLNSREHFSRGFKA